MLRGEGAHAERTPRPRGREGPERGAASDRRPPRHLAASLPSSNLPARVRAGPRGAGLGGAVLGPIRRPPGAVRFLPPRCLRGCELGSDREPDHFTQLPWPGGLPRLGDQSCGRGEVRASRAVCGRCCHLHGQGESGQTRRLEGMTCQRPRGPWGGWTAAGCCWVTTMCKYCRAHPVSRAPSPVCRGRKPHRQA